MNNLLFTALLSVSFVANVVYAENWHLGCYSVNVTEGDRTLLDGVSIPQSSGSVVECCEACLDLGFDYVGLHSARRCSCYNVTTLRTLYTNGLKLILPELCNISCTDDGDLSLPCGGTFENSSMSSVLTPPMSLYMAAGPFLTHVEGLSVDEEWIVVNTPFVIEAVARLAGFLNISSDWENTTGSGLEISFTWRLGNISLAETEEATSTTVRSRVSHTFTAPGNYTIEVDVRNIISALRRHIEITVIYPEPKDLQLALLTPPEQRPSCTPKKCNIRPGTAAVAVFSNYTSVLEASVSVGENLTFVFEFSDDGSLYEHRPSETWPSCEEQNCTELIQDHVFGEVGVYNVTVTATNQYGSLREVLTVVVVEQRLSNVSLTMQPGSATLVTPLQPVKFLMKVETTSRQFTTLELVVNNNNTRVFTVQEFNTTALFMSEPDKAAIAASYGVGCGLEVQVEHMFKSEGVYAPILIAYNNVSKISAKSSEEITVLNKLSSPKLTVPGIVTLNMPANFHLNIGVKSQNVTIVWNVIANATTSAALEHSTTTTSLSWSYTFRQPGHYLLSVTASNLLGNVSRTASVSVHVPITGLKISLPEQFFGEVGFTLRSRASVETGSDVEFIWNFSDPNGHSETCSKNLSSHVNHTFQNPGKYNVSVTARNSVGEEVVSFPKLFIVQQKVTFVILQSTEPSVVGNNTIFISMIDKGTDVQFDFDFGQGRQPGRGKYTENKKYLVTHIIEELGIHTVKVFAYNLVSEVEDQIKVVVEEHVPKFTIEAVGPLLANRTVVLAAMRGGDVLQRPDLLYRWIVGEEDAERQTSRSPLLTYTFSEPGLYNVSLEVSNRLKILVRVARIEILEDNGEVLSLHHCGVAELRKPCKFSILGNTTGLREVTVEYENQKSNPQQNSVPPSGWSYEFEQTGLHRVFVRGLWDGGTGRHPRFELSSVFIVMEPVLGLQLSGPQVVALQRRSVWEAILKDGSHVICVWTAEGNRSLPTAYMEYGHVFFQRGRYVLFVEAFNDVSRVTANLTVDAQHPVIDSTISVRATVVGIPSIVSLFVEGGREFFIHINFGDGSEDLALSSEDRKLQISTEYRKNKDLEYPLPEHLLDIPHNYTAVGDYRVSVNISNQLSWKALSKWTRVDEPITGIVMETTSPQFIEIGQLVQVHLTVATGNDLSFKWHFSDGKDPTVTSDDNSSTAWHMFTYADTFHVWVEIISPYLQSPIGRHLPQNFTAVEIIDDLKLVDFGQGKELIFYNNSWITEPITFTANVLQGSHVTFVFHFGDGTTESMLPDLTGSVTHVYTKVGVYMVSVTAINPLSNMSTTPRPLYIQVAPRGLRLDRSAYLTRFGNDTHFMASITQGTNLTFDWKFGNDQELLDGGLNVSRRYLNPGNFTVSVTARNKVAALEWSATVYVQYLIQGVELRANTTLIASGEPVEFTAHAYPAELAGDPNFVGWYVWKLDQHQKAYPTTDHNTKIYTYSFAGKNMTRIVATVMAQNKVSNATSKPLHLSLLAKISLPQLRYSGQPLINHTILFEISTYSGSELNYTWDFGDGTPVQSGYNYAINHTFQRVGEFEVVGFVMNALSNATVRQTLFILDSLCLPPQISVLPDRPGTELEFEVERSKEVKIELNVALNCSLTHSLTYKWTLTNEETGEPVQVSGVGADVFTERNLYFPPLALPYGNYTVSILVRMNSTIVYSKKSIHLEIVPSLLTSAISGGIFRKITAQENIFLDGRQSTDPDHINSTDMSYAWGCYILDPESDSCFPENLTYVLQTNTSTLKFPGDFLLPGKEFVINLTVSKPGRQPQSSTQTLKIADPDSPAALRIRIVCPACMDGLVNSNQRLALKAVCENCGDAGDVDFLWKVEQVVQDSQTDGGSDEGDLCEAIAVPAKVSGLQSLSQIPAEFPPPARIEEPTETAKPTETTPPTAAPKTVSTTTLLPGPGFLLPQEGSSNGRHSSGHRRRRQSVPGENEETIPLPQPGPARASSRRSQYRRGQSGEPLPNPSEGGEPIADPSQDGDAGVLQNGQFVNYVPEGNPGESGSTGGRNGLPDISEGTNPNKRPDPSGSAGDNQKVEPPGDHLVENKHFKKSEQKRPVLPQEKPRNPFPVPDIDDRSKVFVLKPYTLGKGREYIFIVEAWKKGKPLVRGESWMLIRVNQSPGRGKCIVPDNSTASYELKQKFRVNCREWKDDNAGLLSYEVSYRLGAAASEPFNLIYGGLNTDVEFRLPAGKAPDHLVFVRILISDKFGASTRACDVVFTVLPQGISNSTDTVEQQLYEEVSRTDSYLGVSVSQKDYSNTRVFANYLTLSLNRLGPPSNQTKAIRRKVRHRLLSLLNSFPIRDEYELIQTLLPVVQLTKVVTELDWKSLSQATQLLKQIASQARLIFRDRDNARAGLLDHILEVSSNIMAASTRHITAPNLHPAAKSLDLPTGPDDSVSCVTWAIHAALMLESRYIGEEAVHWSSSYISVFANRYGTMKGPVIHSGEVSCSLPRDMSEVLLKRTVHHRQVLTENTMSSISVDDDCYEAHMITFHENPFSMQGRGDKEQEIHSKITSLKVMDCQGQEVKVGNLSQDNMVTIEIPQKEPQMESPQNQSLKKWQMNVHQFNITEQNFNQSLHIAVELTPVETGRLFPITVLMSCGEPPSPDEYLLKTDFPAGQNTLPFFFPAGTFNSTGPCFLGLVDSNYNAGRPRPQDVRDRDYVLKTWWGQCLFWDHALNKWSGKGCYPTADSSLNTTVCLCNHLTMFASRLDLVPNDLHFTNVDDFFDLYRSPVMFAWTTAVFLVYITAVIICRRSDLHDARKGGVVYLQDNAVTDHQKYEITLETGFRKGAGTTAKISVILHGEEGMSETRELISEDHRPLFERNSRDTFIMTLPNNIGRIWKVQLWHNNSGPSPGWYLSRVIIKDLSCNKLFYFICEKWLAVEEDEGKVEGEFMSLEGNLGFKTVFWAKGTQYAIDFHLWASLFTCPSYSRFTRVQRLTVCLSLLMSYTCLNAMWYRERVEQYRGEFGLLDLSWRSVAVGGVCCAVVIPLHLFLVFLFRRSKGSRPQCKGDAYRTGKCEHLDESASEPVQPVMTHSILDQSLLEWQNIQEWAQKQWVKRQQSEVSSADSVKPSSPQIQHVKKAETLEQASSGFEDCVSQDHVQPTLDMSKLQAGEDTSNHSTPPESMGSSRGGHRCMLPSCCLYLAWTLCVVIIVGCAVITMFYGFRFGKTKSALWLQSFYFSFMICVFISQPFLILFFTIVMAVRYRNDPSIFDYHHGDDFDGKSKGSEHKKECSCCEECEELERGVAARQRSRYLRFARPPQEKQLIEARKKIMKEKKAYAVLQDYWQFVAFFVVLATIAYGKDLSSPYYVNESLKNSLVRRGESPFVAVRSVGAWWRWAQHGLLDGLFDHVAYDRNNVSLTQSTNLYVIGHVHIRQLRVSRNAECGPLPTYSALPNTCHEWYTTDNRAEASFGPGATWQHSVYDQYYNIRGKHSTYDSSGYVVRLNKNRSSAQQQLKELRALDWIDVYTRAVIIEFTIFYAPANLFTSVTLLLETPPTGGAVTHPEITSTYLYRYISVWDNMVLASELFFMVLVLYSMKTVVVEMVMVRYSKYISNPWNVLDVVFCLMALAYMGCYIYRFVLVYDTKEYLLSSYYEKFVSISPLAHWDEILKAMVGLMLAIVTCKFLYLLRYKRTFSNLGNFYKRAYRELFVFSGMFIVFLLAFTSLGYAVFGVFSPNFRDFWVAIETMAGLLVGCHNFPEFEMYNMIGAKLFIFFYLLIVIGTLIGYIVSVLSYQYKIYRQGEMIAMGCSDTLKFFWERFLLWSGFRRPPADDEPDSDLPPEFTMAEIEYQVEELLFRMNAISGSSNLPEKPACYFTDSDVTYGVGDDGISSGEGSEPRAFDEDRFEQRIHKIEENLYAQEPFLAQLIKLNSIGADVLTNNREKQLRSHLELEIFRRLQLQRERRLRLSDRSSSSGGSLSLPAASTCWQDPPTGGAVSRQQPGLYSRLLRPVSVARSESSLIKAYDDSLLGRVDNPNLQTILAPNEYVLPEVCGDSPESTRGFPEDLIREALSRDFGLAELKVPTAPRHKALEKTKSDSTSDHSSASDELKQIISGKSHLGEVTTTSSEDQSRVSGAGAKAKVKHGGEPKIKAEAATPSSAQVFSHSSLRDLPPIEVTKRSIIGSPGGSLKGKPPQGILSLVRPLSGKAKPSGIVFESSSGSEQDAYRGKRPAAKKPTLRKTKSRGKGKGGKRLPTLDSLEDDLSFELDGYNTDNMYGTSSTSESWKDKSSTTSSSETKQAWL